MFSLKLYAWSLFFLPLTLQFANFSRKMTGAKGNLLKAQWYFSRDDIIGIDQNQNDVSDHS